MFFYSVCAIRERKEKSERTSHHKLQQGAAWRAGVETAHVVHYGGNAGCLKSATLAARERLEAGGRTHSAAAIKMRNYD